MPFMCVTCRQIRFVWMYIGSPLLYCTVPHKQLIVPTQTHVQLSVSFVEYHTRIKACIMFEREILSFYCPCLFQTTLTYPMNVRFRGWLKSTKQCSPHRDVHACCMSYDFPHFKPNVYIHRIKVGDWVSMDCIWNWQDLLGSISPLLNFI